MNTQRPSLAHCFFSAWVCKKNRAKSAGPYFRLPFGLCSSPCAQTTLLACRGRFGSLLGHAIDLRGLAGTHQQGAIPQAPEHLRFDSWPRHWAIGLKGAKSYTFLFCEKNRLFFARTAGLSIFLNGWIMVQRVLRAPAHVCHIQFYSFENAQLIQHAGFHCIL